MCDAEYGEFAEHSYTVLQSDATDHWYKCVNCDATTEKAAHSGGTATCTAKAKCEVCDAEYGKLAEHSYTVLQSDATDHWYKCANCDATTEKVAHSGGTATCTAKAKCEVCDAEYGDLADHDYSVLQSDATDHWYKCANCDATTDKTGHTWNDGDVTKAATCKEEGMKSFTCTVCDATKTEPIEIDPTNHADYGTKVENAKAATCEEAGYTGDTVCLGCGEVITAGTSIDPLGHSFTNYVSDGNASCTEDGTKTATCDRCDATNTITDEGSATGHIDADGDGICDDCGANVTLENTCEYCGKVHEGFFGKIVQFFHNIFLKLRKFFGGFGNIHLHSYESVVIDPTCTEQGYTTHTCKICGRTYKDSYTDALGHSFGDWVTDVEATCNTEGHQYRVCDRCGEKEEQSIPISSVHIDVGEDGQCDVCGKTGVCSFCGRIHNGFLGGLVKGVHNVLYTITRFFKK